MAEQNGHDVVNQTLSGGDTSPSDVPASTTDKKPAGGDEGEINNTATTLSKTNTKVESEDQKMSTEQLTGSSDKGVEEGQILAVSDLAWISKPRLNRK
jgi:hypothetical protein